jgi:hypothetical protein
MRCLDDGTVLPILGNHHCPEFAAVAGSDVKAVCPHPLLHGRKRGDGADFVVDRLMKSSEASRATRKSRRRFVGSAPRIVAPSLIASCMIRLASHPPGRSLGCRVGCLNCFPRECAPRPLVSFLTATASRSAWHVDLGTLIVKFDGYGNACMIVATIYITALIMGSFLPETMGKPLPA